MKYNPTNDRYSELAEKWLNGSITPEEEKEYAQWYNSYPAGESLEIPREMGASKAAHQRKLLRQINKKRQRIFHMTARAFYRGAAAILILIVSSYYFFSSHNELHTPLALIRKPATGKGDIEAGTTGAILTLGNGRTIILDTAQNGNLIQGINNKVVKSGTSLTFSSLRNNESEYYTVITPRARQQELLLADGTKVWLNAGSSIKFPSAFTADKREVEMTGEAYFEVAKNPLKPFVVTVENSTVEVLGTHFNIMAYKNESSIKTTLLEGSVKFRKGNRSVLLKPGDQSQLSSNNEINVIPNADVDLAVAWKNGIQSFNNADLRSILRQVERWYDVEVEIKNNIPKSTFSGDIPRTASLSELLKLLQTVAKIDYTIDEHNKKLIINSVKKDD